MAPSSICCRGPFPAPRCFPARVAGVGADLRSRRLLSGSWRAPFPNGCQNHRHFASPSGPSMQEVHTGTIRLGFKVTSKLQSEVCYFEQAVCWWWARSYPISHQQARVSPSRWVPVPAAVASQLRLPTSAFLPRATTRAFITRLYEQ